MLKRNLTMLVGVGLLGANVNFAAAAEGPFPPSSEDIIYRKLPAQEQYFNQRQAANPNLTGASSPVIPAGVRVGGVTLPAQVKYFDQRAAKVQAASAGERTLKATAATKYLNVAHEEIVRIENEKGQSFVWKADTLGEADLSLQAIAPRDFAAGQTRVFVRHPLAHTSGN
jgi:hypothetical protein